MKELHAYKELSGAYILKIFGYSTKPASRGTKYMLIFEYMSRGSLTSIITQKDKLSWRRKLTMAVNVASGMRKIHEHRMIHRDIRPDNILVSHDYTAKIGDMGIARVLSSDMHHTVMGCKEYMPLEFYTGVYDQKLDIFTFGLTLNHLFTGIMHDYDQLNRKPIIKKQSPIFWNLIARCIVTDPKQRPTAFEIEKILDLYNLSFNEMIKQYRHYTELSTEDKDKVFKQFYERFYPKANQLLEQKFSITFAH
ncbi:unnamed protein product [Didymodactylos carnosus]|uniref:Protein kinase domain-containing protein n=1 Tax=Didymodactylos carnosus TaxID=1234261 RepID=A0A815KTY5_9BILA|nr:unnamed protein product [Didymodactylos carnosus]CAF1400771.1 unnamed protein product [Didymodactylos carnosus]CAF4061810.1 unnamed protein product [Didymodactylos carnosus]CAF4294639.1 unnamed protein product [Didymodactylos carnosus]